MKDISKNTMIQMLSIIAVLGAALVFSSPCSAQTITTIAGDGTAGYSGDGGPATSAQLNRPLGVCADSSGNIFVVDTYNNCIRMIDTSGNISTVAGDGTAGYSGDGGPAASAQLNEPNGIYADSSGNIFIADRLNSRIRMIDTSGNISTVAGDGTAGYSGDGGPAASAQLGYPTAVYADSSGNIFVADRGNECIRMFTVGGTISTVAGTGTTGYSGDGGSAISATFNGPNGLCADSSGNIFVADRGNNCIRMFTVGGTITTVAGDGTAGYSGDVGPAVSAQLNYPYGVCADPYDNIFVADRGNNAIRVFTVGGIISTVAGTGTAGYSGDGGPAGSAQFDGPNGLCADSSGSIFIADYFNNRIRKVVDPLGPLFAVTGSVEILAQDTVRLAEDVKVVADNLDTGAQAEGTTDSFGSYQMTRLALGTWKVRIPYEENVSSYTSPEPIIVTFAEDSADTASDIDFRLEEPSVVLSGSVLTPDDQTITEGYSVEAVSAETGRSFSGAWDNGGFSIPLPGSAIYNVSVWIDPDIYPNYAAPDAEVLSIKGTEEISLVLKNRTAAVTGTVKDSATGAPLSGISVNAFQSGQRWFETQTGDDGTYRLNLNSGTWTLKPADVRSVYLFADSPPEVVLFESEETLDFEMDPAVTEITGESRNQTTGEKARDAKGWIYARRKTGEIVSQTELSAGTFSLKVPADVALFEFALAENSRYAVENADIQPDAQNKIVIQLKENMAVIKGKLTDSGGNTVTGVRGTVFATLADTRNAVQSGRIDSQSGTFEISVSEGKWNLSYKLITNEYMSEPLSQSEVNAVSGENPVSIELVPLGGKISGRVTDPDGTPLPNVQVWIRQYLEDGLFEKLVFTDANEGETLGTFSCFVPSLEAEVIVGTALEEIELSSGSVRQSSRSARAASSRRGTPGGSASIELTLRETDTVLAGTVLDTSTGKGVKGAFVYAYSGDGQNASGFTADDSGAFQLKVARAGEGEGDSNIWSVSATWEPSDSSIYYRSSTETIDISGTDYTVTVPELSLEASGTPASAEVYEFSSASGGNCLLSGAGTASGGKKQDSAAQAQGLTGAEIPANVISAGQAQTLKITVDPQTQGLPETATDQLVGPGYAVAMYSKETGKKFDSDLNKEITLTFSYTDEQFSGRGIGETNIRPAYFLEASGSWQPVKNFTIDTEKNTVTFRTDHLSVWALTAPRAGEAEPGDVNNDRFPGKMNDAILALQVCAGSGASAYKAADMNGDGKIGLAEAISILRNLSAK